MTDVTTIDSRPPIIVLRDKLEARREELKKSLPSDISVDRFIRAFITSVQITPELHGCSWPSIWTALLRACRDELLPDGVEGAIVPYKDRATWIAMYQGLLRRFRRSGQFLWITANVVRQGEQFEHYIDQDGEHFHHQPGDGDGAVIKAYAIARTKDGGIFCAILSKRELDKIRSTSRASREDAPWKVWPEEMMKKSAIRRLSKFLPSARDMVGEDDEEEAEPPIEPSPLTPYGEEQQRARGAAAALEQFAGPLTGEGEAREHDEATSAAGQAPTPAPSPTEVAYEAGQAAKAGGSAKRSGIPGPYRDSPLAEAWLAGFDGKPKPPALSEPLL